MPTKRKRNKIDKNWQINRVINDVFMELLSNYYYQQDTYTIHCFSAPPSLAITLFSNNQNLASLTQWQLIWFSWIKIIQCRCNDFSEGPRQRLIQAAIKIKIKFYNNNLLSNKIKISCSHLTYPAKFSPRSLRSQNDTNSMIVLNSLREDK